MDCVACNLPDCSCFLSTATTCQTCVRGARIWLSAAAAQFTQTAFRLVRQLFFFMDETGRYRLVFITDSCFDLVLHNQPQFNYGEHQESSLARILASTYFSVCPTQLWWPDWVSSKIRVPSSYRPLKINTSFEDLCLSLQMCWSIPDMWGGNMFPWSSRRAC